MLNRWRLITAFETTTRAKEEELLVKKKFVFVRFFLLFWAQWGVKHLQVFPCFRVSFHDSQLDSWPIPVKNFFSIMTRSFQHMAIHEFANDSTTLGGKSSYHNLAYFSTLINTSSSFFLKLFFSYFLTFLINLSQNQRGNDFFYDDKSAFDFFSLTSPFSRRLVLNFSSLFFL